MQAVVVRSAGIVGRRRASPQARRLLVKEAGLIDRAQAGERSAAVLAELRGV